MKNVLKTLSIIITVLALLSGCSKKPVKMGFIADLTGRQSSLGITVRNGFQMAVDELNRSGGIRGREIEISIKTTQNDKEVCREQIRELLSEDVDVVIGPMNSSMAGTILEETGETLVISPTVSTDQLTGIDDMFFRVISTASNQGERLAESLLDRKENKAIIVIDEKNIEYTQPFSDGFRKIFTSVSGNTLEQLSFTDKGEFQAIVDKIIASSPEAVVFASSGIDTAGLIQQLSKSSELPSLYSSYWGKASNVNEYGGRTVEGMVLVAGFANENKTERELEFEENYFQRYQSNPTFASQYAYECVMLYAEAVETAKSLDPAKVKEALLGLESFEGITDSYELDDFGDVLRKQSLFIIRNNEYEFY